jgi:hypothetical protein
MIAYIGCLRNTHTDEVELIRKLCAFEGIMVFEMPVQHLKTYYKGGRPVVVYGNEFIDVPSERRVVVYGFYAFVEHLTKHGLIRA